MAFAAERIPQEHQDLLGVRTSTPYNAAERRYSAAVQEALQELLAGRRSEIVLLRRLHGPDGRIEVLRAPASVDRSSLRLPMVERILISTIAFVRDISPGGPVLQDERGRELHEVQPFSTKYPHIMIERRDVFDRETLDPVSTEWRLTRTQNQRMEIEINRWLDLANLALSVVKTARGRSDNSG